MNRDVIKWVSGVIAIVTLCGFIGQSAIRMNRIEKESQKVASIENNMRMVLIYLQLQNPTLYEQAKKLSN